MTHEEWMNKTDSEYKKIAREIATYITFRIYENGSCRDVTVCANSFEREITYGIIMSAFLAYGRKEEADLESIIDTAENAGHFLYINTDYEVNCYHTIYIPLRKVMEEYN